MTLAQGGHTVLGQIGADVGHLIMRGARTLRDPARWSRIRWLGSLWVLSLGTTILGAAFFVAGDRVVVAAGAFAVYARVPGGLHLHGALMLAAGLPLLIGLGLPLRGYPEPRKLIRPALWFAAFYWAWSTVLLAGAAILPDGRFSLVGVVTWTMISLWFFILAVSRPPELASKAETAIFQAAIDAGVGPRIAQEVVRRYFGGDLDERVG